MPKQLNSSISKVNNTPLSEVMHGLMNYGIDGNIISGGMLGNTVPDIYAENADQLATIGTKLRMKDGREFRYSHAGAATIAIASMAQAEAATADWVDNAQTAQGLAIGDTSGTIIIAATAPTVNEWAEGVLWGNVGTGLGQMHRIITNTSHATDVVVTFESGIVTAIPATSEISVLKSNFMDTIVVATGGLTARPIGVPLIGITANYYYWSQVKGPAPMVVDTGETVVISMPVTHPAACAVAGTIGPCVTLENRYGTVMHVNPAAEIAVVDLDLGL